MGEERDCLCLIAVGVRKIYFQMFAPVFAEFSDTLHFYFFKKKNWFWIPKTEGRKLLHLAPTFHFNRTQIALHVIKILTGFLFSLHLPERTSERFFQKMDLLRMDGKAAGELVPAVVDKIFFGLGHQLHHRNRAVGATGA